MKITIIGAGNMGGAIAKGLAQGSLVEAKDITCTALSEATLERMRKVNADFRLMHDNAKAVQGADVIMLAVKPWKMASVIEEIRPSLQLDRQLIVSIAAGVTFEELNTALCNAPSGSEEVQPVLFRVIPNTAIEVKSSMTFVAACNASQEQIDQVLGLFNELGQAMLVEERLLGAGTALASCGIAFAFRYIRAAIEGGVELGFYPKEAREIVAHTVKGAVDLLLEHQTNPEEEIDKVTTPGGITIKGLNEMESAGFTAAVVKGLRTCK